ncbi:VOC family protein [Tropicimonas sp. IMCC34043]|uniref:VOC family protein n=1 Tax=Tropicimonas sp. IMCC34043 TaxID=2248760 RepID=UPI000E244F71|nr:VOC family protein [Tropicimonas sp. IMCC34043]
MATNTAPLEIGRVTLTVNDLDKVGGFYERALGLARLQADGEQAVYGAGGRPLLELRADKGARRPSRREAGLFHTAFLLPSRADLGAWLHHAAAEGIQLQGASDHLVSEALYLADPEGNGIEIYIDRPRDVWNWKDGTVLMATDPIDLQAVADTATAPWRGAPEGTVVGHVHLQVGDLAAAEAFYTGTLGFPVTCHYPGATFFGSGGYHHHLAGNVWNSRGADARPRPSTGLDAVEILGTPDALAALGRGDGDALTDPWGTRFALTQKALAEA